MISKRTSFGSLFALAAGGFAIYRNRDRINQFLESNGIHVAWLKGEGGADAKVPSKPMKPAGNSGAV